MRSCHIYSSWLTFDGGVHADLARLEARRAGECGIGRRSCHRRHRIHLDISLLAIVAVAIVSISVVVVVVVVVVVRDDVDGLNVVELVEYEVVEVERELAGVDEVSEDGVGLAEGLLALMGVGESRRGDRQRLLYGRELHELEVLVHILVYEIHGLDDRLAVERLVDAEHSVVAPFFRLAAAAAAESGRGLFARLTNAPAHHHVLGVSGREVVGRGRERLRIALVRLMLLLLLLLWMVMMMVMVVVVVIIVVAALLDVEHEEFLVSGPLQPLAVDLQRAERVHVAVGDHGQVRRRRRIASGGGGNGRRSHYGGHCRCRHLIDDGAMQRRRRRRRCLVLELAVAEQMAVANRRLVRTRVCVRGWGGGVGMRWRWLRVLCVADGRVALERVGVVLVVGVARRVEKHVVGGHVGQTTGDDRVQS